ncbi:MAG: Xaa-Pro peptidase family protein [Lachnospiraceae bacterium]|nr:Xaa-Pro peptidase family protein [Lachnospiraceae bacterium]
MSRFHKIMESLGKYPVDAMLLSGKPNLLYASGFDSSGSMALITQNQAYFLVDGRYLEEAEKQIRDAQLMLITPERPALAVLAEIVKDEQIHRLGFEEETVTVSAYKKWEKELDCELVPSGDLLTALRSVKEKAEIECLVAAQRIAERAFEDTLSYLQIGKTEREIGVFLQYRMLHYGAEKMSFDPIVVSGPNSSLPHGKPSERPLAPGDFLTMDFGCVKEGYCSDMTRTVAISCMTEEMERVYDTVLAAQLAGIAAAKAGVTGKAVHQAAADVIAAAGYGKYFTHGFGHGVGIQCHEQPMASLMNDRPLPEGAVISAEPGIYIPGRFGVRIEDVIVVGSEKSQSLMEAPKEKKICC